MKRLFRSATLLLALVPAIVAAHDFEVNGIYYNKLFNNEAEVTYRGMDYWSDGDRYQGTMKIPPTVTHNGTTYTVIGIDNNSFYGCSNLTGVYIPNTVLYIGQSAFGGCSSLTDVTIPNSVIIIDQGAFTGTAWFNNQPDGLVYAGLVAYKYKGTMPEDTHLTIREGTLSISYDALSDCSGLVSVTIPNSVTDIGGLAFYRCNGLKSVYIGNSASYINYQAFLYCEALESITVADDNEYYDSRDNCNAIIDTYSNELIIGCKSTVIPSSVTAIGPVAFEGSGLTSVTIPSSITRIGDYAFNDCSYLNDVYSYIAAPATISMGWIVFAHSDANEYAGRTLHVLRGSLIAYQANSLWNQYFGNIVEFDPVMTGDVDCDGSISITDVTTLIDLLVTGITGVGEYPQADMDGDGAISVADVTALIDYILIH